MASRGRKSKSSLAKYSQKNLIHSYFTASGSSEGSERLVKDILSDIIDCSVFGSSLFVRDIVDEIVTDALNRSQKPSKHSGSRVSKKTFKEWSDKFPWLLIKEESDTIRLCCKVCQEQKSELKLSNVWAQEGSPSIQISSLSRHNDSSEHKSACRSTEKIAVKRQFSDLNEEKSELTENVSVSEKDIRLFRTVYFAAKSEMPSDTVNGLLKLQTLNGVDMQYQNLSWDTVTEIQRSIAFSLKKDLVSEVKCSGFYGLLLDESTDVTVEKRLSICIRYVKSGQPVTKVLCNVPVEDGKAATIVNCLVETMQEMGLSLSPCVSLATDGASVMMGRKTGVGVQMQAKYSPFCIQTHCVAHRLNLACTDTIKKDNYMQKFKEKFCSLYYFMSGSSLRTQTLKKVQAILEEPELSIKEPHSIRWLGLKNAVDAVFATYSSVLATLSKFAEEKNTAAKGLFKYFSSYKVALVTAFMLDVHTELAILSCQFQKQNLLFSEVYPLLQGTIAKLDNMDTVDGEALKEMKGRLSVENGVATLAGETVTYSGTMDKEFQSLRSQYLKQMKKNLGNRFKRTDRTLLHDLSQVFEPDLVNSASDKESTEAVEALSTFYGYDKEVKVTHGEVAYGLETEESTVPALLDPEKLQQEWPRLAGMIKQAYVSYSTVQLCRRIILLHSDILPNFAILAKIALCIQLTSVDCERSFSTQNRLKNKYRASLGSEKLDILLSISMIGPDVSSYNLEPAITHWHKKKRRIVRLQSEYKPRVKKPKLC